MTVAGTLIYKTVPLSDLTGSAFESVRQAVCCCEYSFKNIAKYHLKRRF